MLLISRMFNLKQKEKKKRKNIMARKTLAKKTKVLNLLSLLVLENYTVHSNTLIQRNWSYK